MSKDRTPNVFVVRADFGNYTETFRKEEYVGVGYNINEPFDDPSDKEEIRRKYIEYNPDDSKGRVNQNVGQIYRFLNDIDEGDIVITPYRNRMLLVGKVTSEAYFMKDDSSPFTYRKKVEWFSETLDRSEFSIPLQNTLMSSLTVFNVSQKREIFKTLKLAIPLAAEEKIVELSDENIYEAIRKKFLELDATEFEQLVSYILQTLGFEALQETGHSGDEGIDFVGVLNVMGIAQIDLQVQVKRYSRNIIRETHIRSFRGALKKDHQGCFITLTKFDKKAIASAKDQERVPIRLINGIKFVEIFIEQYDEVMAALLANDDTELANKLKFKKVLLPN
ncbi:MAG: DUF2034 domain-containing protein [Candidatus Helarchaeota archaeon]